MPDDRQKFYVTTPIYYVTAKPHLGSLYSTLMADVLARWHKIQNNRVFFLTGTDEHGQKIAKAAAQAGKEPKPFVDSFIPTYKDAWKKFEIDYTYFIRTTDDYHVKAIQEWLEKLIKQGDIYKSFYEGWYCIHDEAFVPEQEAAGKEAPLCPNCGRPTEWLAEETYFFRLSAYQDRLLKFYEEHPDFIIPKERSLEVINFVKSGLKDLSISRTTVKWGIPFPGDSKHVTYVWADALNNYLTGIGYGQKGREKEFASWWPADIQVMGKDIVRFHAIYWPAFLMASGLALPKHLLVHGWIKVGGAKMSKSLGNVVDPIELYGTYGPDPIRYYLMRQLAITHDGEFSIEDLEQKIGSDLADDLGNLLNRMITLALKYDVKEITSPEAWSDRTLTLRDQALDMIAAFRIQMDDCLFHQALNVLWKFINQVNAYFHESEPWKVAAKDKKHFIEILAATAESLRCIAIVLWPIMPQKTEELLAALGQKLSLDVDNLEELSLGHWRHTFMIHKIEPLFAKPAENLAAQVVSAPSQTHITIDDFTKVVLQVGTIEHAEKVEKSDKLLKLQVDFGPTGKRQVLSGIAKWYAPVDLIGKQAIFVTNLAPRAMMGLESQGMLLMAEKPDGSSTILSPLSPAVNGTRLK